MVESLKKLFDTIRRECDFKTVEDYNKFMELGINFLEELTEPENQKEEMSDDEYRKLYKF